jgi:hypothetical protein
MRRGEASEVEKLFFVEMRDLASGVEASSYRVASVRLHPIAGRAKARQLEYRLLATRAAPCNGDRVGAGLPAPRAGAPTSKGF